MTEQERIVREFVATHATICPRWPYEEVLTVDPKWVWLLKRRPASEEAYISQMYIWDFISLYIWDRVEM